MRGVQIWGRALELTMPSRAVSLKQLGRQKVARLASTVTGRQLHHPCLSSSDPSAVSHLPLPSLLVLAWLQAPFSTLISRVLKPVRRPHPSLHRYRTYALFAPNVLPNHAVPATTGSPLILLSCHSREELSRGPRQVNILFETTTRSDEVDNLLPFSILTGGIPVPS
jgi:hypothetical protein